MKKLLISAAALAAFSTGALATDQDITLNATVASFCTIGGSLTPATLTKVIPTTTTGGVVTAPLTVAIGDIVCNKASNVTLSSAKGGLFDPGLTAVSGFQDYISYSASIAAPVAASVTASATSVTPTTGATVATAGATSSAAVSVTITPSANTSPLLAGTGYTDTLKVSVIPQ